MPQLTSILLGLRNLIPRYTLSLIGFVAILTLCWLPASSVQEPNWFNFPNADKVIHFTLFGVWIFCLQRDARQSFHASYTLTFVALCAGLFTAALTEILQPVISNRTRDWADGLADAAGTLVAIGLFFLFSKKK
jgi:VanZ family protein